MPIENICSPLSEPPEMRMQYATLIDNGTCMDNTLDCSLNSDTISVYPPLCTCLCHLRNLRPNYGIPVSEHNETCAMPDNTVGGNITPVMFYPYSIHNKDKVRELWLGN